MSNYKYRIQSKFPHAYRELEEALEQYAIDHELKDYLYQTETGAYKYNAIASDVIEFCHKTFDYEQIHMKRITHFLQGLGLSIAYTYHDIYQIYYKDEQLLETDSEDRHLKFANNYWNFMAVRLKNIAESKN